MDVPQDVMIHMIHMIHCIFAIQKLGRKKHLQTEASSNPSLYKYSSQHCQHCRIYRIDIESFSAVTCLLQCASMSLLPLFVYAERNIFARKTNTSSYILPSVNRFKYWLQLAAHLVNNLGIANLHFSAFFKAHVQRFRWHFESNNSMNQSTTATCNSNNYSDLMAHATRASSMSLLHVERRTSMDILPRSIWMQLVWCDHPICSSRVKAMHRVLSSTLPLSMDQMDAAFVPQRTTTPSSDPVTSSLVRSSFGRTNLESLTQAVDNNII